MVEFHLRISVGLLVEFVEARELQSVVRLLADWLVELVRVGVGVFGFLLAKFLARGSFLGVRHLQMQAVLVVGHGHYFDALERLKNSSLHVKLAS